MKTKAKSAAKPQANIGIIGGSGLYSMQGLSDSKEVRVKTPFGDPSDAIVTGSQNALTQQIPVFKDFLGKASGLVKSLLAG